MFDSLSQRQSPLSARVARNNGTPTIFVNDQPIHFGGVAYRNLPGQEPRYHEHPHSLTDAGIPTAMALAIVEVDADPNYSGIVRWFDEYFAAHPDDIAGCHIGLEPSRRWVVDHPAEMTVYDRPVDLAAARVPEPSWASTKWQAASAAVVESLVRTLHQRFGGRVILYQVGAGACHENVPIINPMTGYYRGGWYCGDFSTPMTAYFRAWLRNRYAGDIDALRRAWSNYQTTFETASVPDRLERLRTEWFSFRSPLRSQTADYYAASSWAIEDCVIAWAEAVKRGSEGHALAASPMGSILDAGLNSNFVHQILKNSFQRAIHSPAVDLFQSPASYVLRDLGIGDTSSMIPLGSLRLAGKIWLRDLDSRTSLVRKTTRTTHGLWELPRSEWEDVQLLKRDVGYSILKGGAFWWHEIDVKMYGSAAVQDAARRLEALGRKLLNADRSTPAGIAVLVDDESNYHQANANRLIYPMNYEARQTRWSHAGLACETYHVDDARRLEMPQHRLFLATNLFSITDAQVDAIYECARQRRATVIWLVAPGVQSSGGFDIDRASRITGFRLRAFDIEAEPLMTLCAGDHPWSRPAFADGRVLQQFGGGPTEGDDRGARTIGPLFCVDAQGDPSTTVLAVLDVLNQPGLAVRKTRGITTVYCSAPYIHESLVAAIGKSAGVHQYLDSDDLVHATSELLLVNAKRAGRKTVRWPNKVQNVIDLWSGNRVASESDAWEFESQENETHLFYAGKEHG